MKKEETAQTILAQAVPKEGFNHHGEAHRMWPASHPIKVTVLPTVEDPPEVPFNVVREGQKVTEMRPNPTVIGQRSYAALRANPRIRILADGASVTGAEVDSARQEVQRISGDLMAAKSEIAELEGELDILRAENAQLKLQLKGGVSATGAAPAPISGDAEPAEGKGKSKGKKDADKTEGAGTRG